MRTWLLLALFGCAAAAAEDQFARIREKVADRTARVPNYTCLETTERRWYADEDPGNRVTDRVRFEVAVSEGKEQFVWPGGDQSESGDLEKIVGRGVTKHGDFSGFVAAIFTSGAATHKLVGEQLGTVKPSIRYDYRVPSSHGYLLHRAEAQAVIPFHGSFWVDPETLELTRLEIEGDHIPPALKTSSAKLAIDYDLVAVGTGTFLLPRATDVRLVNDRGLESRTVTRFSECRQFTAQSTITFEEAPEQQAPKGKISEAALPGGLTLDAELATPIDKSAAAVGDRVQALLRKEVKTQDGIVVPRNALLEGRILTLEARLLPQPCDVLVLRFSRIRVGDKPMKVRASVVRCGTKYRAPPGVLIDSQKPIVPPNPLVFWGGFLELPKGLALTLQTEPLR